MSEDWQIGFKVKGLGAPIKEIVFDDYVLIKGASGSDSSYVFFKFALKNEEKEEYCEVCGRKISKEECEAYDGLCWECWDDQMTEECEFEEDII